VTPAADLTLPATRRRFLPRGLRHFLLQLAIWVGFLQAYELARGLADNGERAAHTAAQNGQWVIDVEQQLHGLVELSLQKVVLSSHLLLELTNATYWLSEFPVLASALLWVYVRRNDAFTRFRNWLIGANLVGLVGYVLVPTAPPRMFPQFVDTGLLSGVNHSSEGIALLANPYAAMPSLHAADALIVGVSLCLICRAWWARTLWLAWPAWVWFSVMATGNHFLLDVLAGVLVALIVAPLTQPWARPSARRREVALS
jgi:membrane-associated phospholipid phosphatase